MDRLPDDPTCERGSDLISFLYGEIDERTARDFERHVLNCPDCESELSAFKQIRSSVVAWRQESLGGATAASLVGFAPADKVSGPSKPSAMAALQGFFRLSPFWMKGSIAFASILFCIVSVLALAHLFEDSKPVTVVREDKQYTEKELQARIEDALKSGRQEWEAQRPTVVSVPANDNQSTKPERRELNRSADRIAGANVKRSPLTKTEREQLAADLRLIISQDDTELDLLGDENNR